MLVKYKKFIDSIIRIIELIKPKVDKILDCVAEIENYRDNSLLLSSINEVIMFCFYLLLGVSIFVVVSAFCLGGTYLICLPIM